MSTEVQRFTDSRTYLGNNLIFTENDFFRRTNPNGALLASSVAPTYVATHHKDVFEMVDVGTSKGKDTWSMAAAFVMHGVQARIRALDINRVVLAQAEQPYGLTLDDLAQKLPNWGLSRDCLDLFEAVDEDHIQPGPLLRSMVTFGWHDIREQPLPGENDCVVANNVLSYYADCTDGRNRLHLRQATGHIAAGLQPGGVLSVSTYYGPFGPAFNTAGFTAIPDASPDPERPLFFAYVPAIAPAAA